MRLVLLTLLLFPNFAFAAPIIPLVIAALGSATWVQLALTIAVSVYGAAQQRKKERRAKDKYNAGLQDRLITRVATESPHVYVYGRAKVGSAVVAIFTSGSKDQYKHLVCVHAAHECDAIEKVYVANKELTLSGDGWVTGGNFYDVYTESATENKTGTSFTLAHVPIAGTLILRAGNSEDGYYAPSYTLNGATITIIGTVKGAIRCTYQYKIPTPRVRVSRHLGGASDTADAYLMSVSAGKWTANHVLRDFTYTVITLDLNQPEFQGGIPEIHVLLRGKKLYDPRTGARSWSQNNALVAYDYLTGPCCNVDSADLPLADYITAANVCDEAYSFGKRYTFNGTVTSDEDRAGVLERIAQSMAGGIVSTTWSISAGKYVAPVMALEQADIVGSIAINPGMSDADIYNTVRGQFISSETGYIATDYKPYRNAVYLAADEKELATNIDLPFTDSSQRVHNLCRIFTEDQRNGYTVKGAFSRKTWKLQIGQRVTLTSTLFGWNAKVFRVTDKSYSPTSAVELTLKEDAASIWDFADAVSIDSTPNSNLPNPFAVNALTNLSCQSGTDALLIQQDGTIISRIRADWMQSDNPYVNASGQIEVQWKREDSDTWQTVNAHGSQTSVYLSPVEDGAFYTVRVRASIPSMGSKSDWSYVLDHQVIGKTEAPPNVETFAITNGVLSWPAVAAPDLAGYLIRFHYGDNTAWSNAAPLHIGVISESPFKPELIPPGLVTLMVKAVDWSGNVSEEAATILANMGDPIVQNLILEVDDKAAGFAGMKTNCAVDGGSLVANDSGDLFWSNGNAPFWGLGNDAFWPTATYLPMEYTLDYLVLPSEVGSRLTLDLNISAASYTVEYRYGAPGPYWGSDADLFWGEDGAKFWRSPTAWQAWPGAIENIGAVEIGFRITAQGGVEQGIVSAFALQFDVEDETEELNDIAVPATGLRLPVAKAYRLIKNIQLTLQDDGGTATFAKWADKLTSGPLIYCYNSAGAKVAGTIDAKIQGVKG